MVKAYTRKEGGKVHRLQNITTQFVSLVRAGANRQTSFSVVKADEDEPPTEEEDVNPAPEGAEDEESDKAAACAGGKKKPKKKDPGGAADDAPDTDLAAWLEGASARAEEMLVDATLDTALAQPAEPSPSAEQASDKEAQDVGKTDRSASSEGGREADDRAEKAEKRAEELERQLRKERKRTERMKAAAVGGSTAMVAGEATKAGGSTAGDEDVVPERVRRTWASGGDLAGKGSR